MLYMTGTSGDYYAVFMKDNGRVVFKFNSGGGPAQIETIRRYNDGEWHLVRFKRKYLGTFNSFIDGFQFFIK